MELTFDNLGYSQETPSGRKKIIPVQSDFESSPSPEQPPRRGLSPSVPFGDDLVGADDKPAALLASRRKLEGGDAREHFANLVSLYYVEHIVDIEENLK